MQIINASYIDYTAKKLFNLKKLYPLQEIVINNILISLGIIESDKDIIKRQLIILPTGYGKSVCFMLPQALLDSGFTLIVYPLHSLVEDQKLRLIKTGIPFFELTGRLTMQEKSNELSRMRDSGKGFILTNPETLTNSSVFEKIKNLDIRHIVIDESHVISQWGKSFRPAYLGLNKIISELNPDITSAFTATASPDTISFLREKLFDNNDFYLLEKSPDKPNIHYSVIHSVSKNRELKLILKDKSTLYPVLIFCRERLKTEIVARKLRQSLGKSVFFYHSGLEKHEKLEIEKWFMYSKTGILVSTCAYGLGVNKPDIRTVIHYSPPETAEEYLQESGRAGRDREPAKAIMLYNSTDRLFQAYENRQTDTAEHMKKYLAGTKCRKIHLLEIMGYTNTEKCNNCDICNGKNSTQNIDFLKIIKKYNMKVTRNELVCLLKGRTNTDITDKLLYLDSDFGKLSDWDFEDIEKLIEYYMEIKHIRIIKQGFSKYKISLNKKNPEVL